MIYRNFVLLALASICTLGATTVFAEEIEIEFGFGEGPRAIPFAPPEDEFEEVEPIEEFDTSRNYSLVGEQVDDDTLKALLEADHVESLTLRNTLVTSVGLTHLSKLPHLTRLSIIHTPITDLDIERLLACEKVTHYSLIGTNISDMSVERMRAMLKTAGRDAEVFFQRGAFLGVTAGTLDGICVVTMVLPESAAAEAGLLPGDIITEFAGRPVPDFETLVRLVGESEIGETTTIVVHRNGRNIKNKVTLKRRDENSY